MKTNELRKRLAVMSRERYFVIRSNTRTVIHDGIKEQPVLEISETIRYSFDLKDGFYSQTLDAMKELFDLATEYASTLLEEREEEKKYIYEFPLPVKGSRHYRLKHIVRNQDELWLDGSEKHHVLQMSAFHFTDKEVEAYPEDIQALFRACKKEEVK